MRKIAMAYLHNKILTLNECSVREVNKHTHKDEDSITLDDYVIYHDRKSVINLLQHILPPVPRSDIMSEVEQTMTIFGRRSFLEEREFSSKVIMDNSVWKKVGETVVKELIYLDNIYQEHYDGRSFLCSSCNDRLVVSNTMPYSVSVQVCYSSIDLISYIFQESLKEDGSSVLDCTVGDVKKLVDLIQALNSIDINSKGQGGGSCSIDPSTISYLFNKGVKLRDTYGGPTLMQYVSERVLEQRHHPQML